VADQPKTYQPHWEEHKHREQKKSRRKHHKTPTAPKKPFLGIQDKQARYGLILLLSVLGGFGLYKVSLKVYQEIQTIHFTDPKEEIEVDVLRIDKVREKNALQMSDSLMRTYQMDSSMIRKVQIETVPVYRPPKREDKWYITNKEWKDIWQNIKIRRFEKEQDEQREKE
jgi:hypothetical protein